MASNITTLGEYYKQQQLSITPNVAIQALADELKSRSNADVIRARKAQLEANQAAIMQQAIANWPIQTSNVPHVPITSNGDYEFRLSYYPQITASPYINRIIVDPEPAKPQSLSYKDFCDIVAAVVKAEGPAIKVVTDCNQDEFICWLECKGEQRDTSFFTNDSELTIRDRVADMCLEIADDIGASVICR